MLCLLFSCIYLEPPQPRLPPIRGYYRPTSSMQVPYFR